jgi:type IV pilus assembly protein PilP
MKAKKNNRFMAVVATALLVTSHFGCSAKEGATPPRTTRSPGGTGSLTQKKISSTTVSPPRERPNFSGRKDPFRSYLVVSKAKLLLPSTSEHQLPIQKYEVNQFKVLGIIAGLPVNQAMVQDPVGKSYVIKEGMMIGPGNGVVVKIKERSIEVAEQYREESGRIRKRVVKLTLPRKE